MPGIPKVQRCQGCKRRKVKCDMDWPTCTPCKRMNLPCSGPSTLQKFVVNGSHSAGSDDHMLALSSTSSPRGVPPDSTGPWYAIQTDNSNSINVAGGVAVAYGFFRLSQQPSTTATDRLTSCLVTQSAKSPGLLVNLAYLKHLPRRLNESPVLYHCLSVFCNSWSNFHRGLAPDQLIEPRLYGRALRSLHAALSGPNQLRVETLTAITLLQRVEVLFDISRGNHQTIHSGGMIPLMMKKGPPNLDDPLDVHLAHEVQVTLATHWLVHRGDNFLLRSPWVERLQEGAERLAADDDDYGLLLRSSFTVEIALGKWPELVHEMGDIHANPDHDSAQIQAAHLQPRIDHLLDEVRKSATPLLAEGQKKGAIREVPCSISPSGLAYEFITFRAFNMLLSYYTVCIILTLMIHDLGVFQGRPNNTVWIEFCRYCSKMPQFIPYLRHQGKLASMLFVSSFCLAFEGAQDSEREYMRDFILETDDYRQRFPRERERADQYFIYVSKCLTGRQSFNLTPRRTETT